MIAFQTLISSKHSLFSFNAYLLGSYYGPYETSQVALVLKNPPAITGDVRDAGLVPGLGRSPGEGTGYPLQYSWASLVAQMVKNLPAMWETWV